MPNRPYIPDVVTVHLGTPSSNAQNVTLSFPEYIKNVASSEIYPTWPESAIRANIYAQISFTLNRIYTEFYRSQGYDFDITNSTATDQSFVYGRDIFSNISEIVDEIFNSYVQRQGAIEPLFTPYCDGIRVTCNGLSQWGSVSLAESGMTPYEILTNYYGNDINIVMNVPVQNFTESVPAITLRPGMSSGDVQRIQVELNRISKNFPNIPKIYPTDGFFGPETEEAVRVFQETFNLTPDGLVGRATWYRIKYIYTAVKRLASLNSEGLTLNELETQFTEDLRLGSTGVEVRAIQYFLDFVGQYVNTIPRVTVDGIYGANTEAAVRAFQETYALPITGVLNEVTWARLYNAYLGFVSSIDLSDRENGIIPFPGQVLVPGSTGEAVSILQEYLNYIGTTYTQIPPLTVDGSYGAATESAVIAFQELFGLDSIRPGVVGAALWDQIADVYEDLYSGNQASEEQFPGYTVN